VIAPADGADLYYESNGSGEPVLLVMGLGMAATGWWRTVEVLAEEFRVIAFDNRGSGRSDAPNGPYSIAGLAADAAAVLDAAGEESAHVYGISLGGMIAQELALAEPQRVRSLVLGASTPGGAGHVLPDRETLEFLNRRATMDFEEGVWASVPYNYGYATRTTFAARLGADIAQRLRYPPNATGYRAQLAAAWGWDATQRLPELRVPALVLHGDEDRIVPVENGRRLAAAIAGSRFEELAGAGHLYPTDEPRADREVLRFLASQ